MALIIIGGNSTGGGGGKEPFIDDTFICTNLINELGGSTFHQEHNSGQSYVVPFMFQQNVTLKQVSMVQSNTNSQATTGYLGIYEYASKVGNNFSFDKLYQESQTFDLSGPFANTLQRITLTNEQTLEAGKIYIINVIHNNNISNINQRPKYIGFRQLSENKILGNSSTTVSAGIRSLYSGSSLPVAGVLPSSVTYVGQPILNASKGGFFTLTLQNA